MLWAFFLATAWAALAMSAGCGPGGQAPNPSGVEVIGNHGQRPGEFNFPRALQLLPGGDFLVIDRSGRVQRLNEDGGYVSGWELPAWENGTPTDLTLAADGTICIADTHYHRLLQYSLEGELLRMIGEYGEEEGKFIYPTSIAFDADGNVYVAEYGEISRIQKFTPGFEFVKSWGAPEPDGGFEGLSRPMAIKMTAEGELLVADSCNHRFVYYSLDGERLRIVGRQGTGPGESRFLYDFDIGPDGRIFACDYGNNRVQVFSPAGEPLGTFGFAGVDPGGLHNPWAVEVLRDGRVLVADTWNHRLQKFPEFK